MEAIFLSNLNLSENEGIYKKIVAEAIGIKNAIGSCVLLTKTDEGSKINYLDDNIEKNSISIFKAAREIIKNNEIKVLYIRHMIPNIELISILRIAKKRNIKIYYEIPTYPYFAEQIRTSRKKYRAIAKVGLDIIFLPIIYKYIYKMVIIKSNTKVKKYKKMVEITNGALVENIEKKSKYDLRKDVFSMVTVGTLYNYHGYDRILSGLKQCNEKTADGKKVEFNIIGASYTIDDLKEKVSKLGLKNVNFLGVKNSQELNQLFDNYDVGLGCLALHRRNADIDTTIKIIEYYCRGIPVVTSGISPMDDTNSNITIHIEDSEEPIDINELYLKYKKIKEENKRNISDEAKKLFSWNNIMRKLFCTDEEIK